MFKDAAKNELMAKYEEAFEQVCLTFAKRFTEESITEDSAMITKAGVLAYMANQMDLILSRAGGASNHELGSPVMAMRFMYSQLTMGCSVPDFNDLTHKYITKHK